MGIQKRDYYRPHYHFAPPQNWMNDPNGLVYFQGEYHLFYQHNPNADVWGPMHWGHAVSEDLINWKHLPIALYPDDNGTIFSGSAVVDWHDTTGFFHGKPGLVAIFTHHLDDPKTNSFKQSQSLAYSLDRGRTWQKYVNNPVLVDDTETDFRDPKVFWHQKSDKWVMVLAAKDKVNFYNSTNLKDWHYLSSFTGGNRQGVWECPDLLTIPLGNDPTRTKWILTVNVSSGHIAGGSGAQYFIGEFNGKEFINETPEGEILWLDYGRDNYAGVSWSDLPQEDGRTLFISWLSSLQYANITPTKGWRSLFTVPRELSLKEFPEGLRLVQNPIEELAMNRSTKKTWKACELVPGQNILGELRGKSLEIIAEFEIKGTEEFGFLLRKSKSQNVKIGYNPRENHLFLDRRQSGKTNFHPEFPAVHSVNLRPINNRLKLQILLDSCSVEVFADDGRAVITDLIFPDPQGEELEIYTKGTGQYLLNLNFYALSGL